MRDNFSALDLTSGGRLRLSLAAPVARWKQKFSLACRRRRSAPPNGGLGSLLPFLTGKARQPAAMERFEGWPVPLSWPRGETVSTDFWYDQAD